jgi:hypothetical protein
MTIIDDRGTPLPDGHPFKGTQNDFGVKRPVSSPSASTQDPALSPEQEPALPPEQEPKA